MGKEFSFNLTGDIEKKLIDIKMLAKEEGIMFVGDTKSGSFDGKISGNYVIEGDIIHININSKPLLAPWSMIEVKLREFC